MPKESDSVSLRKGLGSSPFASSLDDSDKQSRLMPWLLVPALWKNKTYFSKHATQIESQILPKYGSQLCKNKIKQTKTNQQTKALDTEWVKTITSTLGLWLYVKG